MGILVESPSDGCASTASPLHLHASLAIMPRVLRFEAFRRTAAHAVRPPWPGSQTALGWPSKSRRIFGLGFEAQPRNPVVLWPNHCKPRVQTSVVSRYPTPASRLRLRLAVLATMRPALDLVGHRVHRTKPTRLLHSSEVTQTQTFRTCSSPAPRESSRNLHLQY